MQWKKYLLLSLFGMHCLATQACDAPQLQVEPNTLNHLIKLMPNGKLDFTWSPIANAISYKVHVSLRIPNGAEVLHLDNHILQSNYSLNPDKLSHRLLKLRFAVRTECDEANRLQTSQPSEYEALLINAVLQ